MAEESAEALDKRSPDGESRISHARHHFLSIFHLFRRRLVYVSRSIRFDMSRAVKARDVSQRCVKALRRLDGASVTRHPHLLPVRIHDEQAKQQVQVHATVLSIHLLEQERPSDNRHCPTGVSHDALPGQISIK
jgi:hypothetical protein